MIHKYDQHGEDKPPLTEHDTTKFYLKVYQAFFKKSPGAEAGVGVVYNWEVWSMVGF